MNASEDFIGYTTLSFLLVFGVAAFINPAGMVGAFFNAVFCSGLVGSIVLAYENKFFDGLFDRTPNPIPDPIPAPIPHPVFASAPILDPVLVPELILVPDLISVPVPVVTPIVMPAPAPILIVPPHIPSQAPRVVSPTAQHTATAFRPSNLDNRPSSVPDSADHISRTFIPSAAIATSNSLSGSRTFRPSNLDNRPNSVPATATHLNRTFIPKQ